MTTPEPVTLRMYSAGKVGKHYFERTPIYFTRDGKRRRWADRLDDALSEPGYRKKEST